MVSSLKSVERISVIFSDIDTILNGLDDQTNTGKRFSTTKKTFLSLKLEWKNRHPTKTYPFVLRKIKKNQDTRFSLHFTARVGRALESYGPLLQVMKQSTESDLRLWLVDTKYGVILLFVFYCISLPLTLLQKMKQN